MSATANQLTDDRHCVTESDWRFALTPDQIATVEKAARAMFEFNNPHLEWESRLWGDKACSCRSALVALREVGVIPEPPKPKTRGEEWAEQTLQSTFYGGEHPVLWFRAPNNGGGQIVYRDDPRDHLDSCREILAKAFDAALADRDAEIRAANPRPVGDVLRETVAKGGVENRIFLTNPKTKRLLGIEGDYTHVSNWLADVIEYDRQQRGGAK